MLLACGYGSGSNRMGFTALKIAVVAPMPSASVKTAVNVKPGCFRRFLIAKRMSLIIESMHSSPTPLPISDSPGRFRHSQFEIRNPTFLLVAQRHQWIDFRRAPRRHIASEKSHNDQTDRNSSESCRVGRCYAEQEIRQQPRQPERARQSDYQAD